MSKTHKKTFLQLLAVILVIITIGGTIWFTIYLQDKSTDTGSSANTPDVPNDPNAYYVYDYRSNYFDAHRFNIEHGNLEQDWNTPLDYKTFQTMQDDYDTVVFLSSLQGNVNKNGPILFLIHNQVDLNWVNALKSNNIWLQDKSSINIDNIQQTLQIFKNPNYGIRGSVVWDAEKPYTLSIAATIAASEGLVITRKNSTYYNEIISTFPESPASVAMNAQNFQSKDQAYRWAVDNYLVNGKVNPILAYIQDGYPVKKFLQNQMFDRRDTAHMWTINMIDIIISEKAFAFDLAPDPEVIPLDEPNQPAGKDNDAFRYIASVARQLTPSNTLVEYWGFPNYKYKNFAPSGCNGDGVVDEADYVQCGEWAYSELMATYGGVIKGFGGGGTYTAHLTNASFFKWSPSSTEMLKQGPPLTVDEMLARGYITGDPGNLSTLRLNPNKKFGLLYLGDYDFIGSAYTGLMAEPSAVWPKGRSATNIPVVWGITPDLLFETPALYTYLARTQNPNEYFMMINSGRGYAAPGYFTGEYIQTWITESTSANRQIGLKSGYVLNGISYNLFNEDNSVGEELRGMYKKIAPDGIFFNFFQYLPERYEDGTVYVAQVGGMALGQADTSVDQQFIDAQNQTTQQFIVFKNVYVSPSQVQNTVERLRNSNQILIEFVDPQTFFMLARLKQNMTTELRATVIGTTIPRVLRNGESIEGTITIRNDGMDTWLKSEVRNDCDGSGRYSFGCINIGIAKSDQPFVPGGMGGTVNIDYTRIPIPFDVRPGQSFTINVNIPGENNKTVYYQVDLIKEGYLFAESVGNQPWQRAITFDTQKYQLGVIIEPTATTAPTDNPPTATTAPTVITSTTTATNTLPTTKSGPQDTIIPSATIDPSISPPPTATINPSLSPSPTTTINPSISPSPTATINPSTINPSTSLTGPFSTLPISSISPTSAQGGGFISPTRSQVLPGTSIYNNSAILVTILLILAGITGLTAIYLFRNSPSLEEKALDSSSRKK